jgi:hypothetical protein
MIPRGFTRYLFPVYAFASVYPASPDDMTTTALGSVAYLAEVYGGLAP